MVHLPATDTLPSGNSLISLSGKAVDDSLETRAVKTQLSQRDLINLELTNKEMFRIPLLKIEGVYFDFHEFSRTVACSVAKQWRRLFGFHLLEPVLLYVGSEKLVKLDLKII